MNTNENKEIITALRVDNISTGSLRIHIGELSAMGVELKDVELNANSSITDENVKIQCDFVGKLFGQILAKFGDAIVGNLEASQEYTRTRIELNKQEIDKNNKEINK